MRSRFAALVVGSVLPFSQALAQSATPSGLGQPVHQDTTRGRHRDWLLVQRATVATAVNALVLVPTVAAYRATGSEKILIGGVVTQLALTSYAAAVTKGSRRCSMGRRAFMALGGALAGAGGAVLFAEQQYQEQHPHEHASPMRPMGVASLALGVPLGAAAGLYNCT
jgi:hypothetical protein